MARFDPVDELIDQLAKEIESTMKINGEGGREIDKKHKEILGLINNKTNNKKSKLKSLLLKVIA